MVRDNSNISRRKILQTAGISIASISSYTSISNASQIIASQPTDPNTPKFSEDMKKGYSLGTFNNPVTPNTIREIQSTVLDNVPSKEKSDGVILHDPNAKPKKENMGEYGNSRPIGYALKWENDTPHIKNIRRPIIKTKTGTMDSNTAPSKMKRKCENSTRERINAFISNDGDDK